MLDNIAIGSFIATLDQDGNDFCDDGLRDFSKTFGATSTEKTQEILRTIPNGRERLQAIADYFNSLNIGRWFVSGQDVRMNIYVGVDIWLRQLFMVQIYEKK